jgi:hypothetical protein
VKTYPLFGFWFRRRIACDVLVVHAATEGRRLASPRQKEIVHSPANVVVVKTFTMPSLILFSFFAELGKLGYSRNGTFADLRAIKAMLASVPLDTVVNIVKWKVNRLSYPKNPTNRIVVEPCSSRR